MNTTVTIARDEWRYWRRSRLGMLGLLVLAVLITTSLVSTVSRMESERTTRADFQRTAESLFESQPARHPHRMIHYGHYVFRVPAPMALIDPGVDAYAGSVMFLEGHRQNSAVFPPRYTAAHAGPFADLTPAFVYQILLPVLLIVLGFAGIPREREAKTDIVLYANSVTPVQIWKGKTLALACAALLCLLPLAVGLLVGVLAGETLTIALWIWMGYAAYLATWVGIISAVGGWSFSSGACFLSLLSIWAVLSVIVPPVASSTTQTLAPIDGKLVTDMQVVRALRGSDDGHNPNAVSFAALRSQLLAQYEVDDVADLPINFRGVVSSKAEAQQSQVLNRFADHKMQNEIAQLNIIHWLGLLSPTLAIKNFSVIAAGTDLRQHHLFLRQAEKVRFEFVQKLNTLHAEELAYADDLQRSNDPDAEQRTRISAANWRMLEKVAVKPRATWTRLWQSAPHLLISCLWCVVAVFVGLRGVAKESVK